MKVILLLCGTFGYASQSWWISGCVDKGAHQTDAHETSIAHTKYNAIACPSVTLSPVHPRDLRCDWLARIVTSQPNAPKITSNYYRITSWHRVTSAQEPSPSRLPLSHSPCHFIFTHKSEFALEMVLKQGKREKEPHRRQCVMCVTRSSPANATYAHKNVNNIIRGIAFAFIFHDSDGVIFFVFFSLFFFFFSFHLALFRPSFVRRSRWHVCECVWINTYSLFALGLVYNICIYVCRFRE